MTGGRAESGKGRGEGGEGGGGEIRQEDLGVIRVVLRDEAEASDGDAK